MRVSPAGSQDARTPTRNPAQQQAPSHARQTFGRGSSARCGHLVPEQVPPPRDKRSGRRLRRGIRLLHRQFRLRRQFLRLRLPPRALRQPGPELDPARPERGSRRPPLAGHPQGRREHTLSRRIRHRRLHVPRPAHRRGAAHSEPAPQPCGQALRRTLQEPPPLADHVLLRFRHVQGATPDPGPRRMERRALHQQSRSGRALGRSGQWPMAVLVDSARRRDSSGGSHP